MKKWIFFEKKLMLSRDKKRKIFFSSSELFFGKVTKHESNLIRLSTRGLGSSYKLFLLSFSRTHPFSSYFRGVFVVEILLF